MSLYDRFLAPGDLRARQAALAPRFQHRGTQTAPTPIAKDIINPSATSLAAERIDPSRRAKRQNALFFGGLGFTLLSLFITRRSLLRKLHIPKPAQFTPSNAPLPKVEGGFDAAEALGLATLNTVSVFMVGLGGAAIWWDVADMEDLKGYVRRGVGFDVYGGTAETETDRELEEWMKGVMGREGGMGPNIKDEVVQKLFEIEGREKEKAAEGKK